MPQMQARSVYGLGRVMIDALPLYPPRAGMQCCALRCTAARTRRGFCAVSASHGQRKSTPRTIAHMFLLQTNIIINTTTKSRNIQRLVEIEFPLTNNTMHALNLYEHVNLYIHGTRVSMFVFSGNKSMKSMTFM
jgi:hypothetical protein